MLLGLIDGFSYANDVDTYVEKLWQKKSLRLVDGREILLTHIPSKIEPVTGIHIFLKKGRKILWDKIYSDEFETQWETANFIPVIKNKFIYDLNKNGDFEIGVATNHGGMAVWRNVAVIFTVREKELKVLKAVPINFEFSRSIYNKPEDFFNPNYKCELCKDFRYKK